MGRGARLSHFLSEYAVCARVGFRNGRASSVLTRIQKYACQKRRTFSARRG